MFVEELQGGLLLLDSDEFLGAFTSTYVSRALRLRASKRGIQRILRLGVRWRRHAGQLRIADPTAWVAGGLESERATQRKPELMMGSRCCTAMMLLY